MDRSEAWYAGYDAGNQRHDEICVAIEPPEDYTDERRVEFIAGFLVGSRDAYNDMLIDEMDAEL